MNIYQAQDAIRVNEIVNDPSIYPWIKGSHTGFLDLTNVVANKNNVVLVSDHGCVVFTKLQSGIYEFHTSVLPEGRGTWMQEGAVEVFHWMFTKTDAYELMTKCPDGNILAKLGARNVGCNLQFRTGEIWPTNGGKVSVDVYSILIQQWGVKAPKLEETGHQFHECLINQYEKLGRNINVVANDDTHDRYVGAAIEMLRGKQIGKAVNFYNRWAVMAGYMPISVLSMEPLILDISEAKIRISDNNFEVI